MRHDPKDRIDEPRFHGAGVVHLLFCVSSLVLGVVIGATLL